MSLYEMYNLRNENKFEIKIVTYIRITCPCNEYPLIPHFYIAKQGFTGAEAALTCTHNLCFEQKKESITIFHLKIISFTSVKYYSILYGRVFVMILYSHCVISHGS